jgi:hypothetical protein
VRVAFPVLVVLLAAGLAACRPASEAPGGKPLETVDVTAQPDAAATIETDTVARPHPDTQNVAGALPADFPKDVPLPKPSSLVDFGARSVTFEVQRARAAASVDYLKRLEAAGFRAGAGGLFEKGARRIRVAFADASGATRITIEIL